MTVSAKILMSRFLTRSGDHAWDFAVPLLLVKMFPHNLSFAFFYFFAIRLFTMLSMPLVGRKVDELKRLTIIRIGLFSQFASVLGTTSLYLLYEIGTFNNSDFKFNLFYLGIVSFGVLSNIATNISDIAVANDLVPTLISHKNLAKFNSRFKQVDLLTEVLSPVAAGFLLASGQVSGIEIGFLLIVLWNLISFLPELFILSNIIKKVPNMNESKKMLDIASKGIIKNFISGHAVFVKSLVFWPIIAYSCLWVSVLSPHGLLLTAFLKTSWEVPEVTLGIFRSSGAIFGMIATFVYPLIHRRFGIAGSGKIFISIQASMVLLCFLFALGQSAMNQYMFMGALLFSRIGLYGFSLSEMELRQTLIPDHQRGAINGVYHSLTSSATVVMTGLGVFFTSNEGFITLVGVSALMVTAGAVIFNLKVKAPI